MENIQNVCQHFAMGFKKHESESINKRKKEDCQFIKPNKGLRNRSTWDIVFTYSSLFFLIVVGLVNDILRPVNKIQKIRENYVELYGKLEQFYLVNIYGRARDVFNIPITNAPGVELTILDRLPIHGRCVDFKFTGKTKKCINFGSYNYLGMGDNKGVCTENAIKSVKVHGVSNCATRSMLGNTSYHKELEALVAKFVGAEDAITFAMGFATNCFNLPAISNQNCLVLSDEKNHSSIILGLQFSRARIQKFKHNDMKDLEKCLLEGIISPQPRTCLQWEKILIVVEGLYSMEGTLANLPVIIALKKKYKAYLFLDEAHSIGAMGKSGRGIVEYFNCDPNDVDILMGTFTKSFGAAGGYIAGTSELINTIRNKSAAHIYGTAMSPSVAYQTISAIKLLMGQNGTNEGALRLQRLRRNVRYFRDKVKQLGFVVYGDDDSPIVPVIIFVAPKMIYFARELMKRGIAVVAVAYPATSYFEPRIRFCITSSHTKEMLDYTIAAMKDVGQEVMLC